MQKDHSKISSMLDINITFEAVRVTEAAAVAAYDFMGMGDEKAADQAAVTAMRTALGQINIDGTVVIGEGERDKAPMLYIGEKVGSGIGPKIDIALDPLEGTTICATGGPNSMAVIAMSEGGGLLNAPDVYMDKIAIGHHYNEQIIDLDNTPKQNLSNLAKVRNCNIEDLVVIILNRDRHEELIAKVREAGARICLINDGDIASVISTAIPGSGVDMYMGTGGAPEGVLAAAALCTTGGQMIGRLLFDDDGQKERAKRMGISDLSKKYTIHEMVRGDDVMFAATGVTSGSMLDGVKFLGNGSVSTHSIAMRAQNKTIRHIRTEHRLFKTLH
jgi:fructose-1,6-bisphosphatase II / sedoheptulose-1,7-bisphosphatase